MFVNATRLEDPRKSFKRRAYVVSTGAPHEFHSQYIPQGKGKLHLKYILSKEEVVYVRQKLHKTYITVESPSE